MVVKTPHHLDMDGHRIANLDDPTSDTEAATKGYVDRAIAAALKREAKPAETIDVTTLRSDAKELPKPKGT